MAAYPGLLLPLSEADFIDFIYNYFKAEYSPIRSFWSTATAEPRQPQRWMLMGLELDPISWRLANPQSQADIEALKFCIRKWFLDRTFVEGIVVGYSKYKIHERLEKKLYECGRLDLMVRKALKEKHLIDKLWPDPAPKNMPKEMQQMGKQVREWYGWMFSKYFRTLRAVDDYKLKPEVDQKIKSIGTLTLVPFVDHILAAPVEPIRRIVSGGYTVYAYAADPGKKEVDSFGEPEVFHIRFDTPGDVQETVARKVVRQCECLKCGSKRDVQVTVMIDPKAGGTPLDQPLQRRPSNPNTSAPRRQTSKIAQRYAPGYNMPGTHDAAPRQAQALPPQVEAHNATPNARSPSPEQKKQCPQCTFLNHADLTVCEMCTGELPDTLVSKPSSPPIQHKPPKQAHAHSSSMPSNSRTEALKKEERPTLGNRHSISSALLSYLPVNPFSQQQEAEHQAVSQRPLSVASPGKPTIDPPTTATAEPSHQKPQEPPKPASPPAEPSEEPSSSRHQEMTLMPLTPSPTADTFRLRPADMPQNLMDDYVPMSPPHLHDREEEEDAGWGAISREEARKADEEEEEEEGRGLVYFDADAVAQEEMGVWGEERRGDDED